MGHRQIHLAIWVADIVNNSITSILASSVYKIIVEIVAEQIQTTKHITYVYIHLLSMINVKVNSQLSVYMSI